MNLMKTIRLALRTLSRNRLRSFFMMLGVTIGIASLTALARVRGHESVDHGAFSASRLHGHGDLPVGGSATRYAPLTTWTQPDVREAASRRSPFCPMLRDAVRFRHRLKYRDRRRPLQFLPRAPLADVARDVAAGANISPEDEDPGSLVGLAPTPKALFAT